MDLSRQKRLVGKQGQKKLAEAHVAVFGIGGVGGYAAEALVRAGVGRMTLIDSDDVAPSNENRQIIALVSTMGMPKVDAMQARIRDINPECVVAKHKTFVTADNAAALLDGVTYVVDAVDNVTAKLAIIAACRDKGIPAISAMGAGNKLAGNFRVMDIFKTQGDALARVMRRELRKRGVDCLKVVCADTQGIAALSKEDDMPSISYMPGLCGLTLAGEVIRDMIGMDK